MQYLDDSHQDHGLDNDLMDKLVSYYFQAMIDWRTPLADGTLRRMLEALGSTTCRTLTAPMR